MSDEFRTENLIKYYCDKCGGGLCISDKSEIGFSSAYNVTAHIYLHECAHCKKKSDELIKAIKVITEASHVI